MYAGVRTEHATRPGARLPACRTHFSTAGSYEPPAQARVVRACLSLIEGKHMFDHLLQVAVCRLGTPRALLFAPAAAQPKGRADTGLPTEQRKHLLPIGNIDLGRVIPEDGLE